MYEFLLEMVPSPVKNIVRNILQHEMRKAKKLALTSKRVDLCSAQIAHDFHLSNLSTLADKVCLEIGSGWVLSHALVFHLAGAKKVIATDITPHAHPNFLRIALHGSVISMIRDVLSPFEEHSLIRSRLDNLLSIGKFDFNTLRKLGIEYVAPINLAKERLNHPVDFIFSNSVLDSVPCDDVPLMLANLVEELNPSGMMIHNIHLEDHKSIIDDPFRFLSIPSNNYSISQQSSRGNRIRKSGWQKVFGNLKKTDTTFIYEWSRKDRDIPAIIDPSIGFTDEADLRVSHIGVMTRKTI